ncbi:MAG: hypothetical protein HQK66_11400 [Desulfamplus sp.]|nr:hypothetical protein [Desulfamplus sp.]
MDSLALVSHLTDGRFDRLGKDKDQDQAGELLTHFAQLSPSERIETLRARFALFRGLHRKAEVLVGHKDFDKSAVEYASILLALEAQKRPSNEFYSKARTDVPSVDFDAAILEDLKSRRRSSHPKADWLEKHAVGMVKNYREAGMSWRIIAEYIFRSRKQQKISHTTISNWWRQRNG